MEIKDNFTKFQDKYFSLSEANKFKFNTLDYKVDGMIFISSTLIVPFFASFIATFLFQLSTSISTQVIFQLINIVSISIGFICLFQRNANMFWKYGYGWFYLFIFIPIVANLCISLFLGIISPLSENSPWLSIVAVITQIISYIILIVFIFKIDNKIFNSIKETFKNQKIQLIIVSIIGIILLYCISTLFFGGFIEKGLLNIKDQSDNQNNLVKPLNSDSGLSTGVKVFYIIILFILTVLLAPFCEEIAIRYSFFLNCSNKWIAYVSSSIFFGFMHFGGYGDFGHFLSYVSAGFILSSVFVFCKGNFTYSWLVHLLNNLVAFIILVAGVSL